MALTIYKDTDDGAPVAGYGSGNIIKILDACLRTGYGSKPGAGWTKPYVTGTTIAAFKQGTGGNGRFVRIWDARTSDDPATYCLTASVRGYENMTAIGTGTGPFPTTAQSNSNGLMVRVAANGYTTKWVVRANSSWFDMRISTGYHSERNGYPVYDSYFAFGSFVSLKSGDIYNDFILAAPNDSYWHYLQPNTVGSLYVSRSDTATIGSKEGLIMPTARNNEPYVGQGEPNTYPYPNRVNNSVSIFQYTIFCDGYLRGTLPGIWGSQHGLTALGFGNTFGGSGSLAGRSFEIVPMTTATYSGFIFENSDTFTGI